MTNIPIGNQITTLVTVYQVDATRQERLVALLTAAYDELKAYEPGFISGHVLQGLEGTRVVGYTQWESRAAAEAVLRSDEVWQVFIQVQRVAVADPWFYKLAFAAITPTHEIDGEGRAR